MWSWAVTPIEQLDKFKLKPDDCYKEQILIKKIKPFRIETVYDSKESNRMTYMKFFARHMLG